MWPSANCFARDAAREIVHQFFFAHGETLDDAPFLALERFAFKHLGNPPPQKIDSRLHVFFKGVCLAARERQQARTVRQFEIVHVATVERLFRGRVKLSIMRAMVPPRLCPPIRTQKRCSQAPRAPRPSSARAVRALVR